MIKLTSDCLEAYCNIFKGKWNHQLDVYDLLMQSTATDGLEFQETLGISSAKDKEHYIKFVQVLHLRVKLTSELGKYMISLLRNYHDTGNYAGFQNMALVKHVLSGMITQHVFDVELLNYESEY